MTNKKLTNRQAIGVLDGLWSNPLFGEAHRQAFEIGIKAIKAIEQEPCEMTAEKYRQRMIQAFHNANTDELIALCVLPTEKEFEHLEWLLKNHYKQKTKIGYWIIKDCKEQGYDIGGVKTWYIQIRCSECGFIKTAIEGHTGQYHYCPHCGAKMVKPQESEE